MGINETQRSPDTNTTEPNYPGSSKQAAGGWWIQPFIARGRLETQRQYPTGDKKRWGGDGTRYFGFAGSGCLTGPAAIAARSRVAKAESGPNRRPLARVFAQQAAG